MARVLFSLNLNSIDLLHTLQIGVLLRVLSKLRGLLIFPLEDGRVELILPPIELNVEQFVNDMANLFAVALGESLWLDGADGLTAELLKVTDHLGEGVDGVSIVVFEVDKNA